MSSAKLNQDQVKIRHVEPSDAAAMQRVMQGRAAYSGTMQMPFVSVQAWQERLAKYDANSAVLVAEFDGQIVGHAGLHLETKIRRRHVAYLGISVADEFAGRGIGDMLMVALIDLADNWYNVLRLELTVFADNLAARKLYLKHGFVQEGLLRGYVLRDGVLVDAWSMARYHPQPPTFAPA
ncbi:MAG: GNAT family N-acetyltransferase [Burkholderiales bacterium]|nr:GNAT family N-acetyltransferase [Burkholderiales bacterium]